MRDDDLRRRLSEANPWWRAAATGGDPVGWTAHDQLLRDRARYDLGYRSGVLADLGSGPIGDALVLLQGPRRVGKSVVLRDFVAALCIRTDVDPRQVIYVPCDELAARDLSRSFVLANELTRSVDMAGARRRVWLLDEIGQVRGWTAAVKTARDGSSVGNDTVVATSSSWRDGEDIEGNLLAGRAGSTGLRRVRLLLPMTFGDYIAAARRDLAIPDRVHPADLQEPKVDTILEGLRFDLDAYDLAWQAYLTCGGFPRAVSGFEHHGAVDIDYLRDLAAWLRRDVDPDAPADSLPLLLAGLRERATSPMNRTAAAQDLGYPSRRIFDARLTRLVGSFAALWCPQRGDEGRVQPGSIAKFYMTDPVLAWLPVSLRSGTSAPDMTKLTEQALGVAMARAIDGLDEGRWVANDTIGYARTESGNEVDLAPVSVPTSAGSAMTVPVEGKWVDRGWRSEAKTIEGKYGKGILATKSILDTGYPAWAVPAPLLALLLG